MLPLLRPHSLFLALLLGVANAASAQESNAYVQGLENSLIAFSASDFAASESRPEGFRRVNLRYRENDHGARSYMICGQMRRRADSEESWVDFAAIKTSGYENWIGAAATDTCARAVSIPSDRSDLSAALQTKLDQSPHPSKP